MKILISSLLFIILFQTQSKAQLPVGNPITNSTGWIKYGYVQNDSAGIAAKRDTLWTPRYTGSWVYWQHAGVDSAFWVFNGKTSGKKWDKLVIVSGSASPGTGTVTSIATGFGLSPTSNPITTIGTISVDSSKIATKYYVNNYHETGLYTWVKTSDSATTYAKDGIGSGVLGNYAFLYGGWNPLVTGKTDSMVFRANTNLSGSVQLANAPWERRHTFGNGNGRDSLYVFGGDFQQAHYQKDAWVGYLSPNDSTLTWSLKNSNVPWGERVLFGSTYHNGSLYVIGGQSNYTIGAGLKTDVWKSSNGGLTWSQIATGLTQFGKNVYGTTVSFNGYIYVIGGGKYDDNSLLNTYDSSVYRSLDGITWEQMPDAPFSGRQYPYCVVHQGKVFVLFGSGLGPTNLSDSWAMDANGIWAKVLNGPQARHATTAVSYGQNIVMAESQDYNDIWKLYASQPLTVNGSGDSLTNVVNSITGTQDQVYANGTIVAQTGHVTLTLPQNIAPTSNVSFNRVGADFEVVTPLVRAGALANVGVGLEVEGGSGTGTSNGMRIQAGTNQSDQALSIYKRDGVTRLFGVIGDGNIFVKNNTNASPFKIAVISNGNSYLESVTKLDSTHVDSLHSESYYNTKYAQINSGVTSITGTANQIAASASTGAVTLSLPTNVSIGGIFTATSLSGTLTTALQPNITSLGKDVAMNNLTPYATGSNVSGLQPGSYGALTEFSATGVTGRADMSWNVNRQNAAANAIATGAGSIVRAAAGVVTIIPLRSSAAGASLAGVAYTFDTSKVTIQSGNQVLIGGASYNTTNANRKLTVVGSVRGDTLNTNAIDVSGYIKAPGLSSAKKSKLVYYDPSDGQLYTSDTTVSSGGSFVPYIGATANVELGNYYLMSHWIQAVQGGTTYGGFTRSGSWEAGGDDNTALYATTGRSLKLYSNGAGTAGVILKTTGVVNVNNLAGTGSRTVLADASGDLSAPVSDSTVKENFTKFGYGISAIMELKPVWGEYKTGWKNYGTGRQNFLIAQNVQKVIPEAVFKTPSTGKLGINKDQLDAVYVQALQDLQNEINDKDKKIKSLSDRLDKLEKMLVNKRIKK